ncbi:hypothetical protein FHG87_024222 [Trinorchestia longiramus]|nr:hypothetical protein FHG87_024222 [Trinorchestia longiramus]
MRLHKALQQLTGGGGEVVYGTGAVEVAGEVEVAPTTAHHNGIEELLRASAYAPAEFEGAVQGQVGAGQGQVGAVQGQVGAGQGQVVVPAANNNNNNNNDNKSTVLLLNHHHHHHAVAAGGVGVVHYTDGGGAVQFIPQQQGGYRAMEDLESVDFVEIFNRNLSFL